MKPPLGRGHRGGTLSISSRDNSNRGRSGAHNRQMRASACCGGRGVGGCGGAGGSDVRSRGADSSNRGADGRKRGADGRRRRALAHPRPKSVSSSRICHLWTRGRVAREEEMIFYELKG